MSDYVSFFLNAYGGVVPLECIEISHPSFSKVYRYVKNESSVVCISGWAQGSWQNHTVGGRYESTQGRQQHGDPAMREKK